MGAIAIQKANDLEKSLKSMIGEQQKSIIEFEGLVDSSGSDKTLLALISTLVNFGISWGKTDIASILARGQILYALKINWAKLPDKFRSQYDDSYDRFVQERFMLSPSTAASHAGRWEALMSGRHCKIPRSVNVFELNSGRLSAAARLAIDGKLTPKKWDVLTNEGLTNKQVYGKLFGGKTFTGKLKRKTQLVSSTGDLRTFDKTGKMEIIGFLDYNSGDPETVREVQRIIKSSGIEVVA